MLMTRSISVVKPQEGVHDTKRDAERMQADSPQ